jgi:hypothetical protein
MLCAGNVQDSQLSPSFIFYASDRQSIVVPTFAEANSSITTKTELAATTSPVSSGMTDISELITFFETS